MAKPYTFPTLFDDLKSISIFFLSKHKYLKPDQCMSGVITWSRHGNKIGSISIKVNTNPDNQYIELDYKCNETPINYRVQLISTISNLKKGVVWYFICPQTGKLCRKLYLNNCFFYHSSAFKNCLYEKQTQSKKYRELDKKFGAYFKSDKLYSELYKKNFKKSYSGKPTKKYLKLTQQIQKAESIGCHEIELALLS